MVRTLLIITFILIAFIACFHTLPTEGRQIKYINKQDLVSINKHFPKEIPNPNGLNSINFHQNTIHQSKTGKEQVSPVPSKSPPIGIGFHASATAKPDDFRPTTPGVSPGIGHPLSEDGDPKVDPESLDVVSGLEHSVTASKDDFRQTGPGHIPRVGHVFQNKN